MAPGPVRSSAERLEPSVRLRREPLGQEQAREQLVRLVLARAVQEPVAQGQALAREREQLATQAVSLSAARAASAASGHRSSVLALEQERP